MPYYTTHAQCNVNMTYCDVMHGWFNFSVSLLIFWGRRLASRVERDTISYLLQSLASSLIMSTINLLRVERSLDFALQRVNKNISFVLHKVTSGFCPHVSFSRCEFDLAVHDIELESAATLHFDTLFNVKNPEFDPALEFILHHCRRKLWPPYNLEKQNEQGVMIEICSQILAPLCTEVTLESRYKTPLSSGRPMPASITCSHIGIGSNVTWHGTPDARVRGGVLLCIQKATLNMKVKVMVLVTVIAGQMHQKNQVAVMP